MTRFRPRSLAITSESAEEWHAMHPHEQMQAKRYEDRAQRIKLTDLGGYLRSWRKEAGLTLKEAGERADISLTYLSNIERSHHVGSVDTLQKLLDLYGIEVAYVPAHIEVRTSTAAVG